MSKQTLSVADFVTIVRLVDCEIYKISNTEYKNARMDYREVGEFYDIKVMKETVDKALSENVFYQDLLHLKNSLQNLQIEIETPKVEIKEDL